MRQIFFFVLMFFVFSNVYAQDERSPFRKGYMRLGINNTGGKIDQNLSVKDNILDNRYGSGLGYVFEVGRNYYFNKRKPGRKLVYGLDWTILSLTYNSLNKWNDYTEAAGVTEAFSINPLIATVSSKLGPVISYNPVEKLVIDFRGQVLAGINGHIFAFEDSRSGYAFSLLGKNDFEDEEESVIKVITKMAVVQLKPSFGITVRRQAIGLAVDYAPGKLTMNYAERPDNLTDEVVKPAQFKTDNLQLKLSLTF